MTILKKFKIRLVTFLDSGFKNCMTNNRQTKILRTINNGSFIALMFSFLGFVLLGIVASISGIAFPPIAFAILFWCSFSFFCSTVVSEKILSFQQMRKNKNEWAKDQNGGPVHAKQQNCFTLCPQKAESEEVIGTLRKEKPSWWMRCVGFFKTSSNKCQLDQSSAHIFSVFKKRT